MRLVMQVRGWAPGRVPSVAASKYLFEAETKDDEVSGVHMREFFLNPMTTT